jgi:hypothetical protein
MTEVSISVNPIQMFILKQALEIEIKSGVGGMQLTREPALRIFKRLIADQAGIKVGRGIKGRQDALDIVEALLAELDNE